VRDWETDEKKGRTVEIEAEALGHDLSWGTAAFTRSAAAAVAEAEAEQPQVESQADSTASELGDIPEQEPLGTPVREPQADEVAAPF
jgi:single-strand DNA-binding protein